MCGIFGVINQADQGLGARAVAAMQHRGPDDAGVFTSVEPVPVTLANVRLAILDLSAAGHQPMHAFDGRYTIVYNGEVYNFRVLRQVLEELGHTFHTDTDTEVILQAYAAWGQGCLEHLRGMFAFAIWDREEGSLFAARDRLGVKPLYYVHHRRPGSPASEYLAFASELKTLLATGLAERRLNLQALHHYLSLGAVPGPYTLLEGVTALPPGHWLRYAEGRLTTGRYWSIPPAEPALSLSQAELIERLRALLEEAIRLRMVADVPVGAFLSGGVDSGAVVALMTHISGARLKTFSIGFGQEGQAIDERSAARRVAERFGTDHTEVIVDGRQMRDQLERIIWAVDQPSTDGLNTYFVSQMAAQHGKVALSGLGGDELFAGYPQFDLYRRMDAYRSLWGRLPGPLRGIGRGAAGLHPRGGAALTWLEGDFIDRYERVRIHYGEARKLALYTPDTAMAAAAPEPWSAYLGALLHPTEAGSSLAQLTRLELSGYMANTLLRDTDAMSMAHALEVRVPLIDHKLVEFAVGIPAAYKLGRAGGKLIFKQALADLLPPETLQAPKRGFEMPVQHWLRTDLRDVMADVLSPEAVRSRGLFKPEMVKAECDAFQAGSAGYLRVWMLAVLELWMRQYLDQPVGQPAL